LLEAIIQKNPKLNGTILTVALTGWSGFVLVGGRSSRMGRDKALLELDGVALAARAASLLAAVCDVVALVGDAARYGHLGYPVFPDEAPAAGPLAGIVTALGRTASEWNLILACDMPAVTPGLLAELQQQAGRSLADCVVPSGSTGLPEPLCAAYRRRCLAPLENAVRTGNWKLRKALELLRYETWTVPEAELRNVNTPAEWDDFLGSNRS
jgi:molybdopterin-guanine dinucleotide biosynthesis protein A